MLEIAQLFDENFYLLQNPDVSQAVTSGSFGSGLEHFNLFGQFEGRDPSSLFDTNFYLESYPDVEVAVLEGKTTAIEHFIEFGQVEGRNPITEFDTSYDLANNPDLAAVVETDPFTGMELFAKRPDDEEEPTNQRASHPLDPLNEAEIETAVSVIRQEQNLSDSALFPNISLQEPDKTEVLTFTPGEPVNREAFVTVLEREQNKVYEAIVDLETRQLTSWKEVPGAQPAITAPEFEILS